MTDESTAAIWVDTHAHLDDDAFAADRDETVARAAAAGVGAILNVGYRRGRWPTTIALGRRYPSIGYALGIHPGHADELDDVTFETLSSLVASERPAAIGEIGLDYFDSRNPSATVQQEALRRQLRLASRRGLPAIIHQRAAETDILALLESEPELPPLVLHSFDGGARYAGFARERGCFVGVGGLATRVASASLRAVLATIPPEQILLETDSPYLIPAGARGRRNEPANVPVVGEQLCGLWALQPPAFARLTTANAARAFAFIWSASAR